VIKKKAREKDEEVSYVKSTYSEDIFPWQCCYSKIHNISSSSVIATLFTTCPHDSNATIQIFSLLWQNSAILLLLVFHYSNFHLE